MNSKCLELKNLVKRQQKETINDMKDLIQRIKNGEGKTFCIFCDMFISNTKTRTEIGFCPRCKEYKGLIDKEWAESIIITYGGEISGE